MSLVGPSAAVAEPRIGQDAIRDFGTCVNSGGAGDVLLLIDDSGSLKQTDPDGTRVLAAAFLVRRFAEIADRSGSEFSVSATSFAAPVDAPVSGWQPLSSATVDQVEADLQAFAGLNRGIDTDYWVALDNARQQLSARARDLGGERCQAIVLFSDGEFDVDPRDDNEFRKPYAPDIAVTDETGATAVAAAARSALCSPGGLADQVWANGITTITVGLDASGTLDFGLLSRIATGEPTVEGCPDAPQVAPRGAFFAASSLEDLLQVFNRIGTGEDLIEQATELCAAERSDACAHQFVLDQSIGSVDILATSDQSGVATFVQSPDGTITGPLSPADVAIPQTANAVVTAPSPRSLRLSLTRPTDGSWTGLWKLYFVDTTGQGGSATSQLLISGDIVPAWPAATSTEFVAQGSVDPLAFGLARGLDDAPVAPADILGSASLSATLTTSDGVVTTLLDGVDATQPLPPATVDLAAVPPGVSTIRLTLNVTTAPVPAGASSPGAPGTTLSPAVRDFAITVAPPPDYPVVATSLDFGKAGEVTEATAGLPLTGPGCVWVSGSSVVTVPDGATSVTVSAPDSQGDCVQVAEGETGSLPVTLTLDQQGNGTISGVIEVSAVPADGDGAIITQQVPYVADVARPLSGRTFLWALILALVLGIGLPVALALLARRYVAAIPRERIYIRETPARSSYGSVTLDDDGAFEPTGPVELLELTSRPRRLTLVGQGVTLAVKLSSDPRKPGQVEVESAPGTHTVAPHTTERDGQTRAVLPLAVHNSWFAIVTPGAATAKVVVLLDRYGNYDVAKLATISNEIQSVLPRESERLLERYGAAGDTVAAGGPSYQASPAAGPDLLSAFDDD